MCIILIIQDRLVNIRKFGLRMELMNGGNTNTPDDPNSISDISTQYSSNNGANRGRHESEEWYYLCESRSQQNIRKEILFIIFTSK